MKMKEINFTASQQEAIKKINDFMNLPVTEALHSRVFVLKGQAGTGKTTIIKYALKDLIKGDISDLSFLGGNGTVGVTMAHKAKNVLKRSIPKCFTYAAFFGMKQSFQDDGTKVFVKDRKKNVLELPCEQLTKVIIHDECSMYDQSMLDNILENTHPYSKIIFMGDPGQLPPVNNDVVDMDSPVFSLDIPESNTHLLRERVRQTEGNPIVELSDIIYDEIFGSQDLTKVIEAIKEPKMVDGVGYDFLLYKDFLKVYKESSKTYMDSKIIAYTNKKVSVFNESVRNYIYNKPDTRIIPGEIIYMNNSFSTKHDGENITFFNSDEYVVKDIDISKSTINKYQGKKIKTYSIAIDKKGHPHLADTFTDPCLVIPHESGDKDYKQELYFMQKYAKEESNPKARSNKWKNFYNLKEMFADISYGYCYTGYKAQGSTYKTVFVDINDILTLQVLTPKRKLQALYTAITRASHKVYLLRNRI